MKQLSSLLVLTTALLGSSVARADDFPAGGEHDFVAKTCVMCHDAATVTSQHLTQAAWAQTIERMKGNGAVIPDAEIDKLVTYLAQNFGPAGAAPAAPAAAAAPAARAPAAGGAAPTPAQRARDPMALAQYPLIPYQLVEGQPIDTRWPEKQDDAPNFPGQTRAPYHKSVDYNVTTITNKLIRPWAVDFLPDGKMIVTQRLGSVVVVDAQGNISKPVTGVPTVSDPGTQAGLLDVALDPKFAANHRVFFTYTRPSGPQIGLDRDGAQDAIAVSSATFDEANLALTDVKLLFVARPAVSNALSMSKIGSRIAFAKDGSLFVTVGDRDPISLPMPSPIMLAQHLNNTLGKVIHITPDGKPASDNPFLKTKEAQPEIWAYGMRSMEGIAFDAKGQLWASDEQQRGGSEVNLVKKGTNYGWPVVTHGMDYTGNLINDGITHKDGMEDSRYYWDPAMAPSGMTFYNADLFPAWKGNLLVSTLRGSMLARLTISKDNKILSEEPLLAELKQRLRDVQVGPDGAVYVVTDRDSLLKLTPK